MRKEKNKNGRKIFVIILILFLLIGGIFCAIYFLSKSNDLKYYNVQLGNNSAELSLSTNKLSLSPNDNMISKPVKVSLHEKSENSYIRAKIVFENYSDDSRVLSFVSQLNFGVKNFETYVGNDYSWQYFEGDNSFYLITNQNLMKIVSPKDGNLTFVEKLTIPNTIKQMSTLNDAGENVQIGEDVVVHITFEAVQFSLPIKNSEIETVSEYFNISSCQYENGFYVQNGFIVDCDLTNQETLILPKKVGNDYVLGIKENAFENTDAKQIIASANYIYFEDNAFANLPNLNFVALKNQINISLSTNTFASTLSQIFVSKDIISSLKESYQNYSYFNNIKQITEISSNDTSKIDSTAQYLYSSTITSFEGDFKNLSNLKVVDFPVLETINEEMFSNLNNLLYVECPNVKLVGNKAFNGCSKLIQVVLSKNLENIGENSFFGCSKLQEATFVKNLQIIPKEAFRGCTSLTTLTFNSDNLQVENSAFYGCNKLRIVKIENLNLCENYCFGECNSLRYVIIKSLNDLTVNEKAFSKQNGMINASTLFVFESEEIKTSFANKFSHNQSQDVVIKIENGILKTFSSEIKNVDLTDFNIISTITGIGNNVFKDNQTISSLVIPFSVKEIGNNAFDGADKLVKITINNYKTLSFSEKTFENVSENLVVYVPGSVLNVYKQTYENLNVKLLAK